MRLWIAVALMAVVAPVKAQLVVKLSPQTVAGFEEYVKTVESQVNARWQGRKNLLLIEDDADDKQRVLAGEVFIKHMNNGEPVSIQDGLIHDWLGAVYIPDKSAEQVVRLLEDFDRHRDIYPAVAESHVIRRNGDEITGYWQLRQKNVITVVLDVEESVRYQQIAPGKWKGAAYARHIVEEDTGLFSRGKKFPPGEGHGYLWRLYSYWTLEEVQGGVVAECRTLSLSRDIPQSLAWAIAPYVEKTPRDSLVSILNSTRATLEKQQ
jgi:hypothetical protein